MEDCPVKLGTFTSPSGFTELINTEGLCVEDIDEDENELWVIQTRSDVDITNLTGQQLFLGGPTTFRYATEDGSEQTCECIATKELNKQIEKACLVLPKRNSMKLCAAKQQFEGIIFIDKSMGIPSLSHSEGLGEEMNIPKKLKKRFEFFGSGNPFVFNGNDKRRSVKCEVDDLRGSSAESSQDTRKKTRHLIQDAKCLEQISVKNKKKQRSDKVDLLIKDIKTEELSADEGNSYPVKNKSHRNVAPEYIDHQMSVADICHEKDLAPRAKKKKHRRVDEALELVIGELRSEVGDIELSTKPHKEKHTPKKHENLEFSNMDCESDLVGNSQEHRSHDKRKNKSNKLKKVPREEFNDCHSSSISVHDIQIKEEIVDDYATDLTSFHTKNLNGVKCKESSSSILKKKSKKKKTRNKVSSEDES